MLRGVAGVIDRSSPYFDIGQNCTYLQQNQQQYSQNNAYPQQPQQPNAGYPNQGYRPPNQAYPQQPNYNQGGYRQPAGGYNQGGYHQPNYHQPNYHMNQQGTYLLFPFNYSFHSGTGPGSVSRGSQWKTALAAGAVGAVGGVLAYEAGKAIIKSATEPVHVGGRSYYFNNDQHQYQQKPGELTCSMPLQTLLQQTQTATGTTAPPNADSSSNGTDSATPSPDQLLSSMQFQDGSRPKTVTWTCRTGAEVCCGTECCPAPPAPQQNGPTGTNGEAKMSPQNMILIVFLVLLLLMCCCCFIVYAFFRSLFYSCCRLFNNENSAPYNDEIKYVENQPQSKS
ncbi:unnamed protein product [Enterobius vermicularis]|uniref:CX domain-containing protein n=1 Tax=Enterobius vermicularis TaxID=51028 RepID=A0A0N4UX82_ENTVE|nr:unnamed protein product [Enterobius vermicularis]